MSRIDPQDSSPGPIFMSPAVRFNRLRRFLFRSKSFLLLGLLLGYVTVEVQTLWGELWELQHDRQRVRGTTVIGYEGIHPNLSSAAYPANWFRQDGEETLLWSGWDQEEGHRWFRVGRGELERSRISSPIGRDVIPAIDWPIVEVGGGPRWDRIPEDSRVAGLLTRGVASAYPVLLLSKVEVVNDEIASQPLLITFTPFLPIEDSIQVYDPVYEGHRLTLGSSGYLIDSRPLLYDRGTESFWMRVGPELRSIAGPLKGATLRRLGGLEPVSWSQWRERNPEGRLVVGSDRSRARPET